MTAQDEYMRLVEEAQAKLEEVKDHLDNFGEFTPDDVTWANVGDMNRLLAALSEVMPTDEEYAIVDGEIEPDPFCVPALNNGNYDVGAYEAKFVKPIKIARLILAERRATNLPHQGESHNE